MPIAPRKLKDCIQMCEDLGLNPTPTKTRIINGERTKVLSTSDCAKAIQEYFIGERKKDGTWKPILEKVMKMESPMLALQIKHLKPEVQDLVWEDNSDWVFEEKIDGNRMLVCFTKEDGFDFYSRNNSVQDFLPISYQPQILLPELNQSILNQLPNFILDCEVVPQNEEIDKSGDFVPVADTQLNLISSILALNPEDSHKVQERNPIKFVAFDLIYLNGNFTFDMQLRDRLKLLTALMKPLQASNFPVERPAHPVNQTKREFYEMVLAKGGEGVVAKDLNSLYDTQARRHGEWAKIKRSVSETLLSKGLGDTIDAFITGFTPGTIGTANEGLVGSIHFSTYLLNDTNELILDDQEEPKVHEIAVVSGISQELRELISTKDDFGNVALNPDFYGRVAELDGQDLSSRNLRFMHAIFKGWRPDRSADSCRIREDVLKSMIL